MKDVRLSGEVQAVDYEVGLEAGIQVLTPDGKTEFYQGQENSLYKAYQRHIDFGIVTPFVVYNGSRVLVKKTDKLVTEAGLLVAILNEAMADKFLKASDKETETPKETPVNIVE